MLRKSCVCVVLVVATSSLFADNQDEILRKRLEEAQAVFSEFDRASNHAILAAHEAKKQAEMSTILFLRSPRDQEKLNQALLAQQNAQVLEKEMTLAYADYLFAKALVQAVNFELAEFNEQKAKTYYQDIYQQALTDKSKQTLDEVLKARYQSQASELERFRVKQAAAKAAAQYENFLKTLGPFTDDPPESEIKESVVWV